MHRYCIMQHGFYIWNRPTIYQYFSWLEFKWHNDLETRHPWIWIASACGLAILISRMTRSSVIIPYLMFQCSHVVKFLVFCVNLNKGKLILRREIEYVHTWWYTSHNIVISVMMYINKQTIGIAYTHCFWIARNRSCIFWYIAPPPPQSSHHTVNTCGLITW